MGGRDPAVRMIIRLRTCRRWELMGNYGIMCKSGHLAMAWSSTGPVFKRADSLLIAARNCIRCLAALTRSGMTLRTMAWALSHSLERVSQAAWDPSLTWDSIALLELVNLTATYKKTKVEWSIWNAQIRKECQQVRCWVYNDLKVVAAREGDGNL